MPNQTKNPFNIGSSIPILRMLDEARTKQFYLDYLGYTIDWEHRFTPDSPATSPLYMQISLGNSILHLDGHKDATSPTSEVRIPVDALAAFCDSLNHRVPANFPAAEPVDPRGTGENTEINLPDPSGNLLVFWRQ